MRERALEKFRVVVILVNLAVASIALANLATLSTRAIEVSVPEEDSLFWSLDISNQRLLVQSEYSVKNQALYDIRDIDVEAVLYIDNETQIMRYEQKDLIIPRFSNQTMPITASIGLKEFPFEQLVPLIVLDADFTLQVNISAKYLWGLGEFRMNQEFYFPWESPLKTAITSYLEEEGLGDLLHALEAAAAGNTTAFYEMLDFGDIQLAFEIWGAEISIQKMSITSETLAFEIETTWSEGGMTILMNVPLADYKASTINIQEASGNE